MVSCPAVSCLVVCVVCVAGAVAGVHIADVAHFVRPNTALDTEAAGRSTSVYLVQRVVPMLPRLLCEDLCSLNPGTDRFAFSVVWELTPQGVIVDTWVGRSVIASCAKLSYNVVQRMIDGCFVPAECDAALHGGQGWPDVEADCLALHRLAQALRAARFANGALRLDNTRLSFVLDKERKHPVSYTQYVQREANQLVEEFMLLANMSVARIIADTFPQLAVLRRHPPPRDAKMKSLEELADLAGYKLEAGSAAALQRSLDELRATCYDRATVEVIIMLCTKPMQLAEYFCTGEMEEESGGWRHYALAVDHYTHFTSPIRRYPDVLVHRLLAAALDVRQRGLSAEQAAAKHLLCDRTKTASLAAHANERRLAARNAQDASLRLYLAVLLHRFPLVVQGVVTQVGGDRHFTVYIPEFGQEQRYAGAQQTYIRNNR